MKSNKRFLLFKNNKDFWNDYKSLVEAIKFERVDILDTNRGGFGSTDEN